MFEINNGEKSFLLTEFFVCLYKIKNIFAGGFLQSFSSLACCITHVYYYIRNGIVIKLTQRWQLKSPFAYDPSTFKRKVPLIFKIEFKHSTIILSRAGGNGIN